MSRCHIDIPVLIIWLWYHDIVTDIIICHCDVISCWPCTVEDDTASVHSTWHLLYSHCLMNSTNDYLKHYIIFNCHLHCGEVTWLHKVICSLICFCSCHSRQWCCKRQPVSAVGWSWGLARQAFQTECRYTIFFPNLHVHTIRIYNNQTLFF